MSVLGELDLLGPRAHGAACGEAVLKAVAEDFQVDEVLDIPLSGEGEHLWLWVEKRGLNTEEAARRLGRAAGVQQKNVSYAGLKDRQALTRQWFSLHLPGKADPDLGAAEGADLRILRRTRHSRKLQRGAHAANGFTLRLTGLRAERALLDARLERIAADGVPNYFGLQRFGHGGGNLVDARSCAGRACCRRTATCVRASFPPDAATCSTACSPSGSRGELEPRSGRRPAGLHRQPQLFPRWRGRMPRCPSGRPRPAPHRTALGRGRSAERRRRPRTRAGPGRERAGALPMAGEGGHGARTAHPAAPHPGAGVALSRT